jgi:hypothetical protein
VGVRGGIGSGIPDAIVIGSAAGGLTLLWILSPHFGSGIDNCDGPGDMSEKV